LIGLDIPFRESGGIRINGQPDSRTPRELRKPVEIKSLIMEPFKKEQILRRKSPELKIYDI